MNKLILVFNQSGSYKGGAQKRYIHLFNHLNSIDDQYYLLLNDSLYYSCVNDGIIKPCKNIIHIPILFERKSNIDKNKPNSSSTTRSSSNTIKNSRKIKQVSGIRTLIGRTKYFFKCLLSSFVYSFKLFSILSTYNIKNIYCVFNGGVWSCLWLKLRHKKYIYSYNDTNFSQLSRKKLELFSSEYWAIKYAFKTDCLSPYIKEGLLERFDKNSFITTPNSFINYSIFKPHETKENIITFCSRLEILKNPFLFVEAINDINDQLQGYRAIIIGDGRETSRINDYIQKNQLEDIVILKGALSSSLDIVSKSKIFVSIQEYNNYPSQSLLEAMACENAIIASDVGETRLLVDETVGVLTPLTKESIGQAILKLIQDEKLCLELGQAGRKSVTSKHTIENFSSFFNGIMNY